MRQRQGYKSPSIETDGRTLFDIRPSEEKDGLEAAADQKALVEDARARTTRK